MYCNAHKEQERSPAVVAEHVGLLVVYWMELEISLPWPSCAYTAQLLRSSADIKASEVLCYGRCSQQSVCVILYD